MSSHATAMSRSLIGAAAVLVLLTGAARAQLLPLPGAQRPPHRENALQQAEGERQYRAAVNATIPDKKPSNDPWKNVRTAAPDPAIERHRPQ
jgi:hypothetical protein